MKIQKFQFDGGRAQDTRNAAPNQYALAQHFDVSQKHKLIPYRDMETEGALTAYAIKSVCLFTDSAGTQAFFALGNVSGQTYPQMLEKSTLAGTFALSTTGASASGTVLAHTLIGYKNQNKLYNLKTSGGTTILGSYDPASNTYAETVGTISDTATTGIYPRPIIHSLDDTLYAAAGNTVAKLDGLTFTASAVTVPAHLDIVSMAEYGPYLALLCAPVDIGGRSVLFLWGRDTSIVEMDEAIDMGEGAALVLENIQGRLIAISAPATSAGTSVDFYPTIVFRQYAGGTPQVLFELRFEGTGTPVTLLKNLKAKHNDDLFFALNIYLENKNVNQVWRCGFNEGEQFFVTPDRLANNDTALTGNVDGLDIIADVLFVAFNGSGALMRTNDSASFTATSILETETFRAGENETIKFFNLHCEPVPSGGQAVLKYRVNEATSWTTAATWTTENALRFSAVTEQFSTKDGKEWHFRIESTGGLVVTGYDFETKPKADKPA